MEKDDLVEVVREVKGGFGRYIDRKSTFTFTMTGAVPLGLAGRLIPTKPLIGKRGRVLGVINGRSNDGLTIVVRFPHGVEMFELDEPSTVIMDPQSLRVVTALDLLAEI
jgi:hypothetical protein